MSCRLYPKSPHCIATSIVNSLCAVQCTAFLLLAALVSPFWHCTLAERDSRAALSDVCTSIHLADGSFHDCYSRLDILLQRSIAPNIIRNHNFIYYSNHIYKTAHAPSQPNESVASLIFPSIILLHRYIKHQSLAHPLPKKRKH